MRTISTWGLVYDGGNVLKRFPNGTDQPWNKTEIAVPAAHRAQLYAELTALEADRYAETPVLDALLPR